MPKSLVEMCHAVFDPRSRQGRIHDLVPTLSLAVVAILAGRTSLAGIARFGRDHKPALAHALGFRRGTTPSLATYSRLFRRLDIDAFEAVLGQWIVQRCPDPGGYFALDGKTRRRSHDGDTPAVHLLAVFAPTVHAAIGQLRVDANTGERKAALVLLGVLPSPNGTVVTGDAMFCRTEIAEVLGKQGAEHVPPVKGNRPAVTERIADLLDPVGPPPTATPDPDVSAARTANEGHGRIEVRTARSCDLSKSRLRAKGFVGAEQVIRVERTRTVTGEETRSVSTTCRVWPAARQMRSTSRGGSGRIGRSRTGCILCGMRRWGRTAVGCGRAVRPRCWRRCGMPPCT